MAHFLLFFVVVLFLCLFHFLVFSMHRTALWLYIPFRKVSTWGLYDHLARVLYSWPFPIWLYLGRDILSSTPALKNRSTSRYITVSCSRARPSISLSLPSHVEYMRHFWERKEYYILKRIFSFHHSVSSLLTIRWTPITILTSCLNFILGISTGLYNTPFQILFSDYVELHKLKGNYNHIIFARGNKKTSHELHFFSFQW